MPKRKSRNKTPKAVEAIDNSSDDEEIDEDEAFNSEDEKKYGAFFVTKKKALGEDDEESSSDDESSDDDSDINEGESDDEEAAGQAMMELLDSAFGRSVKKATTPEAKVKQKATLDQLLEGLEGARGFGDLQTVYKHGLTQPTAPPVPHADKLQRKVHYELQSDAVSEFQTAVNSNRVAETLDFRPEGSRILITRDDRVDQFEPTTDFELKIHDALSKLHDGEREEDDDDLGDANVDFETLRERQKQLSKMRSLMFAYEQKRHHMKKIKSKTYRRIRKRQRQKESEGMAEEKQLREQQELDRMKERATLTHKNTSKWAKRILKKKHGVDVNTRRALSAQLQRSADLRAKLTHEGDDETGDEEDLAAVAKDILNDGEEDKEHNESGIFSMKFMKKGAEKQREQAKKEARELLAELEATNEDTAASDTEDPIAAQPKKDLSKASKKEMTSLLKDGEMMVTARKYGPGAVVATAGVVLSENVSSPEQTTEHVTTLDSGLASNSVKRKKMSNTSQKMPKSPKSARVERSENPWLAAAGEKKETKSSTPKKSKTSKHPKGSFVDVDRAVDLVHSTPDETKTTASAPEDSILESNETKAITLLTQEELIEKAFATLNDEEIEKEFAEEKQAVQERETAPKKKKTKDMTSSSGWGSWTGKGAKPTKRRFKFPKGFEPPPPQKQKRKCQDSSKPHVILSQKRVKKTADKYMLTEIPYPFTSREEYERSLAGGIGPEWNVTSSFKAMTRPEIYTRAGKIIQPISKKMKVKRAPAKF